MTPLRRCTTACLAAILAGLPLKSLDRKHADCLLVAVTEKRTKDEIDAFADALAKAVA